MNKNKKNSIDIFNKSLANDVKQLLINEFWKSPIELASIIHNLILSKSIFLDLEKVIVTGETTNLSVYVIRHDEVILYSPFQKIDENVIMEINPNIIDEKNDFICILEKNEKLLNRLDLPKVYLINPSVKDVFPVPRLAICISSLASYLRKLQMAEVKIKDMQINSSLDDILTDIKIFQPDVIGISISFGQATLADNILMKIYADKNISNYEPIITIGNVISSFGNKKWIEKYPNLIVCMSEGENSIVDIVKYKKGLIDINDISGIYYGGDGLIKSTKIKEIRMNEIPLPSMDTVSDIFKNNGVLTMETSRGCFHSACSFCPRTHKCSKWKGMSPDIVLKQLSYYKQIFDIFKVKRRIFMADEEFIGWMVDGNESKRIIDICKNIIENNYDLSFETNTRVDQIYDSTKDKKWHIERMKMIKLCRDAGLERLLVGVESGSDSVLKRFNKGIQKFDSIMAIRILTALGVGLRATFIMFDPLMNFNELKENIKFLERKDVYLNEISLSDLSFSDIYERLNDEKFINKYSRNTPLYEHIAYMLVLLEVLMNSDYIHLLLDAEKKYGKKLLLNDDEMDLNMARYKVNYLNDVIGDISNYCQRWIDKHFAVDYCLKGMYKIADESNRKLIFKYRAKYRELSFNLLKTMIYIFDGDETISINDNIIDSQTLTNYKNKIYTDNRETILLGLLEIYNKKLEQYLGEILQLIDDGFIKDENNNFKKVINNWKLKKGWDLINP